MAARRTSRVSKVHGTDSARARMSINGDQHGSGDSYEEEIQDDTAHQVGSRYTMFSKLAAYHRI